MKIKELLLPAILFAIPVGLNAQSNTFPNSGNVGIGITSPAALLHVYNPTGLGTQSGDIVEVARFAGGVPNNSQIRMQLRRFADGTDWLTASTRLQCVTDATSQGYLEFNPSGSGSGTAIGYGGTEVIRFRSNGRIGIGTENPATYFSVTESTPSGSYGGYPAIEVNNPNTTGDAVSALVLRSGTVSAAGLAGAVGGLQCKSVDNATQLTWLRSYAAAYPIYIGYNQTDLAVNNGKVGIGTTSPVEKLSVEGTILAQKVRVSQAASDWPDYVFEKDYSLMPLDSVETFIQANGHLPEIASSDEVSRTGIDLGDNQTKLLQKTEELTLYLIEQNKQLAEQNKQIQELKQLLLEQQKTIKKLQDKKACNSRD